MGEDRVLKVIERWADRETNSKKFNEVFKVDGIPVWYFLGSLLKGAYLPRPFKTSAEIEEEMRSNRTPTGFGDLKSNLIHLGLRKGLWINERIKWRISSAKRKKAGEKDVLFLGYTNEVTQGKRGELRPIGFHDVIDTLNERGVKPLVLFCDPISANSFGGLLKFENLLYSYIDPEIIKESRKLSRELNQEWKKISEGKKAELFTFDGKKYWRFMKSELNFLFSREMLATLITYYLTFKKIVESHKIKLIFLVSLGGFYESLLLGVAYKLNKKVIYSAHGYGGRYFIVSGKLVENVFFAAWGNEEKGKLLRLGIKKENIFITGSPLFDIIAKYKSKKEKPKTGKVTTLITQPLVEDKYVGKREYFNYIQKFLIQIAKVKNIAQIIIKLHPREKYKSHYESIAKSLGLKNVSVTQELGKDALYSILGGSDLLVSTGSTTDIEGMMLDKDVVVIEGLTKGPLAELAKKDRYRKAVVVIDKDDDLASMITKIFTNKDLRKTLRQKRHKYLVNSFYRTDGKAHERVADLILRLIKQERG
jgi:hypothetical protein